MYQELSPNFASIIKQIQANKSASIAPAVLKKPIALDFW